MIDRGLWPDSSRDAIAQLDRITGPATGGGLRDLRELFWASIDNDDSRDLDQLSVCQPGSKGSARVSIAIADVDALVARGTPIDDHARHNTTSVYTAAEIFPMLPERLSTDLTSLNEGEDRAAVVVEMAVTADGSVEESSVFRALIRSRAKLAYDSVAAWLEGGPAPPAVAGSAELQRQLRSQDALAQSLREVRYREGALDLQTIQPKAVFDGESVVDLREQVQNRARQLIEEFMVAANGVTARTLEAKGFPSLRRIVRSPERWPRIVEVARELGGHLPPEPDSKALSTFLTARRRADPLRFPDLSLIIVKLLGSGEYVLERPGQDSVGHFGLARKDYTHSTAPNRRFPDLVTQRLLKATLAGDAVPYSNGELDAIAINCTNRENDAEKIERQVRKSAAALLLESRIGQRFDAIVTGASEKGTWVRIFSPPVEGKLVHGWEGLDVGERLRVKLIGTDVEKGFIDFIRVA